MRWDVVMHAKRAVLTDPPMPALCSYVVKCLRQQAEVFHGVVGGSFSMR